MHSTTLLGFAATALLPLVNALPGGTPVQRPPATAANDPPTRATETSTGPTHVVTRSNAATRSCLTQNVLLNSTSANYSTFTVVEDETAMFNPEDQEWSC
ncbi:hypothetical protein F4778DRAFT_732174 [Xylariomycetidae sp. FL2044]|nr:hypothetical protein F4778DRAFT_732174 [Xylariomycetidae sp. FL2044]